MTKAFDCVLHHELLSNLFTMGISGVVLKWFHSYLTNRKQRVKVGGTYSDWYSCSRGVPQGSVLGPLLFSLYIRKLPSILQPHVDNTMLFADDISFDCTGSNVDTIGKSLSDALSALLPWLLQRGLNANMLKTHVMLIQPRGTPSCSLHVTYDSQPLQQVSVTRFLGLRIDDRLQWSDQVDARACTVFEGQPEGRRLAAIQSSAEHPLSPTVLHCGCAI